MYKKHSLRYSKVLKTPTGLEVLPALCSRQAKDVFEKAFRLLNHVRRARQLEQLQKSKF